LTFKKGGWKCCATFPISIKFLAGANSRDAPDILPDQIGQPDIRLMYSWSNDFLIFSSNKVKKKCAQKLI
jgi:hypothetical protein